MLHLVTKLHQSLHEWKMQLDWFVEAYWLKQFCSLFFLCACLHGSSPPSPPCQLAPDDAWKCPHCKQLQQGMVKMSLWTLPDILILHLKRFRQVGERRNKLTTFVHFPLAGLDMAPHMVNHKHTAQPPPLQPACKSRRHELAPPDFLYDLYAVCNHHGGMHGGHYTGVNSLYLSRRDTCNSGHNLLFFSITEPYSPMLL